MARGSLDSYDHHVQDLGFGCYRVSWIVDKHYPDSRMRFQQERGRETDLKGAIRFVKKWNVTYRLPESVAEAMKEKA